MKLATCTAIVVVFMMLTGKSVLAASNKCRVVEVDEERLVLECDRDTSKFKTGDRVKIKSIRKDAAIEGC